MSVALAAARERESRRHLAPVGTGGGEAGESLADRLSHAQAAVAAPRRRVSELEAALAAAVEQSDYEAAAELQEQLPGAREALALAEVDVRVIEEAQAALAAAADAERRAVEQARQRDDAQRQVEASGAAEQQILDQVDAALVEAREHLTAARGAWLRALNLETRVLDHRRRAVEAQRVLGEFPAHHPGPAVVGPNQARSLADTDPLVAELARWRG
jgi:hypothetical protein